jgi:FkbM family methyltransferase
LKLFKNIARWLLPNGLIESRRRRLSLNRLGLPMTTDMEEAVGACRYDLWPKELKNATEPWTLVDVGANEGEFSAAAAHLAKLSGIHAFEPQPACRENLEKIMARVPGSQLHPVAVGEVAGELELHCTTNSRMASLLAPTASIGDAYGSGNFEVTQRLKVPIVTLDDSLPPHLEIGLLKIDVQGYELPVLRGAQRVLKSTKAVLMEVNYVPHYEGGATFDEVHEIMRSMGFRTFAISAPYAGPNGPLWADAVFVRA